MANHFQDVICPLKEFLETEREKIRKRHDKGLNGPQVCSRLTAKVDEVVQKLLRRIQTDWSELQKAIDLSDSETPSETEVVPFPRITLVAHGGYGRRHLAPFSDVDLMILYDASEPEAAATVARRLTQDIYDVGLKLGHSLRTTEDALRLSSEDPPTCTSLLESRLLVGDMHLYEDFRTRFDQQLERRKSQAAADFIAARSEEREKFGESVYLLEPNIKRSRGGLRDIHFLRWINFLNHSISDPDQLRTAGVLSKFDHRRLISARNFLLRLRNEMHFSAGRISDALSRDQQLRLADYFGYRGATGILPVEQFMRDYFNHTNHIWQMVSRAADMSRTVPRMTRLLDPVLGRSVGDSFRVGLQEISATRFGREKLKRSADTALQLIDLARDQGKRIGQETWYHIYRSSIHYSADLSQEKLNRFLEVLRNPKGLGLLLRRLHELGVLEKYLPGFSHARGLLQFNQYHKYTVDAHSLLAVEHAARFRHRIDRIGETYRSLRSSHRKLLHFSLLIHDLGKGYEEDHSDVGARIADQMATRFSFSEKYHQQLVFLVQHHLLMNQLAFRRDTSDKQLLIQFAVNVRSRDLLKILYLHACADLAAVGPGTLNSWKVEVLTDLYLKALPYCPDSSSREVTREESMSGIDMAVLVKKIKRRDLFSLLSEEERADENFWVHFHQFPDQLLSHYDPASMVRLLRELYKLEEQPGYAWSEYSQDLKMTEYNAIVTDGVGRGIFSSMAGALSSAGLQIYAAETHILSKSRRLLRFVAEDPDHLGKPPKERAAKIIQSLLETIHDPEKQPIFRQVWGAEEKRNAAALSNLPNQVHIDNEATPYATIVEVYTINRAGLLYELARAIHEMRLTIHYSKTDTHLDQAVAVFYVTERIGSQVNDSGRLKELRRCLNKIIEAPSEV